ncbi:8951_t:CDS:2, partial [Gigaspora rosea]
MDSQPRNKFAEATTKKFIKYTHYSIIYQNNPVIQPEEYYVVNTADSIGITNLNDNAAAALALDAEYRIHEIIQEANKFMRYSKRTKLTGEDINNALRVINVD